MLMTCKVEKQVHFPHTLWRRHNQVWLLGYFFLEANSRQSEAALGSLIENRQPIATSIINEHLQQKLTPTSSADTADLDSVLKTPQLSRQTSQQEQRHLD